MRDVTLRLAGRGINPLLAHNDCMEIKVHLSEEAVAAIKARYSDDVDMSAAVELLVGQALWADPLLSVTEAAEVLGISGSRVRELLRLEKLKGEKTSAGWGIKMSEVNQRKGIR